MTEIRAHVFLHPGTDPALDRTELDREGRRTLLVAVPDVLDAPLVARALVEDEGVRLIELCGSFGPVDVARVLEEVGEAATVGHTTFPRPASTAGA
ncbi:DUF6506 family protein [Pseudonocardia spirodelae]|uniref:DUF6506 family protein n=1 Tax=Pseudonocardia spirodelae TaxID=3133431 RepID=A0ABU8TA45_9PSEU